MRLTSTKHKQYQAFPPDRRYGGNQSNGEEKRETLKTYVIEATILIHTKTVTAAFHLNNREAKRELKVYNNGRLLPFRPTPTYLGVKLDRSLTFCHLLVALRKKLSSRVTLLRRLVGSG